MTEAVVAAVVKEEGVVRIFGEPVLRILRRDGAGCCAVARLARAAVAAERLPFEEPFALEYLTRTGTGTCAAGRQCDGRCAHQCRTYEQHVSHVALVPPQRARTGLATLRVRTTLRRQRSLMVELGDSSGGPLENARKSRRSAQPGMSIQQH